MKTQTNLFLIFALLMTATYTFKLSSKSSHQKKSLYPKNLKKQHGSKHLVQKVKVPVVKAKLPLVKVKKVKVPIVKAKLPVVKVKKVKVPKVKKVKVKKVKVKKVKVPFFNKKH